MSRTIDAACYNRVCLAVARLGEPLEVEIASLRLTVHVERRLWVARSLINAIPLMAWLDFDVARSALHEPVSCRVHLYHFHAGLLMGHTPQLLAGVLEDRLSRRQRVPTGMARVTALTRRPLTGPRSP